MQRILDYTAFCKTVTSVVNDLTDPKTIVKTKDIVKNNNTILQGLIFSCDSSMISPTIYLNSFYEEYESGRSIEAICTDIIGLYDRSQISSIPDMERFLDFDRIRDSICYKLINTKSNISTLETIPHIPFLDLSIVFICYLEVSGDKSGSVLISNEHMNLWHTDVKELYRTACANTGRIFEPRIFKMSEMINDLVGKDNAMPDPGYPMYILTNTKKTFGASCMLYPDAIADAAKLIGDDLFIIPSSIHELILVPKKHSPKPCELNRTIREVNKTAVADNEYLSDHCYYYSAKKERIFINAPEE